MRESAAGEVAQAVREIGIVATDERIEAKTAVLTENDFAQQKIAQGVDAHGIGNWHRSDNVTARLTHFTFFKQEPAVREHLLRQFPTGSHQECGPKNGVETKNFFADQVQVGWPTIFAVDRADIGGESVKPDVEDVGGVGFDWNSPFDAGAGDGKVGETLFDKGENFIAANFGQHEIRIFFVELEQTVCKCRKFEEIVFFGDFFVRFAGFGVDDRRVWRHLQKPR